MPDNTTLLTRSGLDLDVAVFLSEAAAITYSVSISIKAWALANAGLKEIAISSSCSSVNSDVAGDGISSGSGTITGCAG